jgi:NAD-dependent deacetylase
MTHSQIQDIIRHGQRIVFFGGAGTSTESNIPDFRSATGLYQDHQSFEYPPEVMLSHSFFKKQPASFYQFYLSKMIYPNARPNPAHHALAELERRGQLTTVITQNIDGLHQMAGSQHVLELHGSVHRNHCITCGQSYDLQYVLRTSDPIPHCEQCNGIVKPDVVLYEEMLDEAVLQAAIDHISKADVLIVGGTSLRVNPAASLIRYYRGEHLVLINKEATPYDSLAHVVIHDLVGKVLQDALHA